MRVAKLLCMLALLFFASDALAQTGKIAGRVTDQSTGDPLPGVNVVIEGTTQGSTTDVDGYYTILNVRPGTYSVRASYIGYTPALQTDVRVNIDLTTPLDFALSEQTAELGEVVVAAERPVVQRDVSASVANLNAEEIENLPVTDVAEVIGLQAGFERGLTVRGQGGDQVQFQLDGMSMASGIYNTAFTGISYTAVEEVQVQTGGFNAEYGNVRSGLINVVSKEGGRDRYSVDAIIRYSSPSAKNFDGSPKDASSLYMRPYFSDEVDPAQPTKEYTFADGTKKTFPNQLSLFGTENWKGWNDYEKRSYPKFEGWLSLYDKLALNSDDNPANDLSPEQMREAYNWYRRKDLEPSVPDYEFDATIGGPIPLVSKPLGNLRFTASFRQTQNAYMVAQSRDSYDERTIQTKITSDLAKGMKLNLTGLYANQAGINPSEQAWQGLFDGTLPYYPWNWTQSLDLLGGEPLWSTHWRNPSEISHYVAGAQLVHTLSPRTFYEVQLQRYYTDYFTHTYNNLERDTTAVSNADLAAYGINIDNQYLRLNEEPFGWQWADTYDKLGVGQRTGGHWYSGRDTSDVTRWVANFKITSQINRFMEVRTGLEYIFGNWDINFGEVDPAHPHHTNPKYVWQRSPQQGAAFGQTKLEFKGMVANLGMRVEYFHAGGDWYNLDAFDRIYTARYGRKMIDSVSALQDKLNPTSHQFSLSPRLGVSFPITENSKLYFNYGHFRNMLNPMDLFNIAEINTGAIEFIGNPDHPMPKTVSYELGFEQNLFDQFHLRLAGYYRDQSNQQRSVYFESIDREVRYNKPFALNYGDTRGLEITLSKNRGKWLRGFVNYTYMSNKGGNFGLLTYYENRVQMREYITNTYDHYQWKARPEPYGRFNLEVIVPEDFGPSFGGLRPIADWRINFLGEWRQAPPETWDGSSLGGGSANERAIRDNTRWKSYKNLDMRFSKNFKTPGNGNAQFFIDVTNVLNLRHMHRSTGWAEDRDEYYYLTSLHWPKDIFEGAKNPSAMKAFIPGNDRPGVFRDPDVPFQPIEIVDELPDAGNEFPLYYLRDDPTDPASSGKYYWWRNGAFAEADGGYVKEVIDEKRYIDMPNRPFYTFLNPRNVFFGLRLSF